MHSFTTQPPFLMSPPSSLLSLPLVASPSPLHCWTGRRRRGTCTIWYIHIYATMVTPSNRVRSFQNSGQHFKGIVIKTGHQNSCWNGCMYSSSMHKHIHCHGSSYVWVSCPMGLAMSGCHVLWVSYVWVSCPMGQLCLGSTALHHHRSDYD